MRVVLYLLCLPWDLTLLSVSWLLLPMGVLRTRRERGVMWFDMRPYSFLSRRWPYSTTLGHLVLLRPGLKGSDVEDHELVHVRQYEGAVCSVWIAAACVLPLHLLIGDVALLLLLILGPWWGYAGASLAAYLRGQHAYLENHYERHARAEVRLGADVE